MNDLIQQGPFAVFFALAIGHALADFPLQGAYLANQKSRTTANGRQEWIVALSAHCLIHAGSVWLFTGILWLALAELVLHGVIDFCKGEGKFGMLTDQILHLVCKAIYVLVIWMVWLT